VVLAFVEHTMHAGSGADVPRASGILRAPAASAWHMGAFPKPKTTPPGRPGAPARGMPAPKPPSNRAFHEDVMKSMVDPARGSRVSLASEIATELAAQTPLSSRRVKP
jgi:hypothetical protein